MLSPGAVPWLRGDFVETSTKLGGFGSSPQFLSGRPPLSFPPTPGGPASSYGDDHLRRFPGAASPDARPGGSPAASGGLPVLVQLAESGDAGGIRKVLSGLTASRALQHTLRGTAGDHGGGAWRKAIHWAHDRGATDETVSSLVSFGASLELGVNVRARTAPLNTPTGCSEGAHLAQKLLAPVHDVGVGTRVTMQRLVITD